MNLDKFDKQILDLLNFNARTSFANIGREIGLTAPAVKQRVQKMESSNIINGYTLNLDNRKLGITIKAIVTIKVVFGKLKAFQKEVDKFDEVKKWFQVTGEDCLIMHVHLRDNQHMVDFLDQVTKYGNTKTNIVLAESK